ncbi:hypothetical protein BJV85_001461 [Clostridium acetobutylicum]|uniref:HAD superfamily hydrolase n=1 Tax=Clostridium acetobutylicum (strain ATCC 824 / DSM 792 / JCM 1419 / IAM 19013 / LMG 5710 / NBRC 13948 / NRRL B-527 / VKM B-1787 / 2291 / W) TaxID=272562 RepID=Q97GE4_CLOAB|nr:MULTISPECIES: Cof-type HAD-IIB family hydrolase [Clostridium]AAK80378.1 HAD superfamily hydrolase [Clostridium acetobutylicum ATCC 824]ADZ21475.1 HAD superfamily hydrolase [Clostridium acetobutylicum EA 2018]AEI34417.1 HAD family phosphatase [Clostridium acetobutylicum DSM 1731]AWV79203.1 Cof-type HAD-IIB family hydrolase [Clostridium acetobutylicum]MBC2394832.1 Cof-type HAD-IIB family hydrolase [Clostridium acetobutylicum]
MNKKIIFFDIDGTLLVHNGKESTIPYSTKEALKKLKEKGHNLFICSGRPIRFAIQEFQEMVDGYICCNGTYIVYNGKCIYNKLIDKDTLKYLIKEFCKLGISASFSGAYNGYSYNMSSEKIHQMNRFYKTENPYILDNWNIEEIEANNVDVFFKNNEHMEKCIKYLEHKLIFNTHKPYLSADVSFKNWDKSKGIEYLVKYMKRDMKDTMAFGDGKNDITMLKTVNIGIAMGNAVDEVKNKADMVTDSAADDGIYNALNKLHLI